MIDIRIRVATPEDLEQCAICWGNRRDTYPSIYPLRLVNPSVTQEQRLARNVKDLKKMLNDPRNDFHVASIFDTTPNTELVVGYSIWAKPEGLQRDVAASPTAQRTNTKEDEEDEIDPECDHELAKKIGEESKAIKAKVADGKRFWLLQQLFVHGDYQRRGIGKALVEHGLNMIEQSESSHASQGQWTATEGYKIGLTSSPQGQELYKRYGFRDVYWFNPKFDDVNEHGEWIKKDVRWPLMIKE